MFAVAGLPVSSVRAADRPAMGQADEHGPTNTGRHTQAVQARPVPALWPASPDYTLTVQGQPCGGDAVRLATQVEAQATVATS
jgi:hypothetical protein